MVFKDIFLIFNTSANIFYTAPCNCNNIVHLDEGKLYRELNAVGPELEKQYYYSTSQIQCS